MNTGKRRNIGTLPYLMHEHPIGFFDGAATKGYCGVRFVVKYGSGDLIKGWTKTSIGASTRTEVVGLWCLLTCAKKWGIRNLQVLGDSQC